jgi:hypothetical protein
MCVGIIKGLKKEASLRMLLCIVVGKYNVSLKLSF